MNYFKSLALFQVLSYITSSRKFFDQAAAVAAATTTTITTRVTGRVTCYQRVDLKPGQDTPDPQQQFHIDTFAPIVKAQSFGLQWNSTLEPGVKAFL